MLVAILLLLLQSCKTLSADENMFIIQIEVSTLHQTFITPDWVIGCFTEPNTINTHKGTHEKAY